VLSTLHTNDSVSAIVRLLDLGIPSFLISSSVTGILAQRLVRKLCACHSTQPATPEFHARLSQYGVTKVPARMAVPVGCDRCDQTGYKGRIGIYELLLIDNTVRSLIRSSGTVEQIRDTSRANGMRTMQEDAADKLSQGLTTVEEILRVVPVDNVSRDACSECNKPILPTFKYCPYCGTKNPTRTATSSFGPRRAVQEEAMRR
jgi:type II secretory ATPase GspE/PulE/Tfp pilus assembly ATPase PilB-like protein